MHDKMVRVQDVATGKVSDLSYRRAVSLLSRGLVVRATDESAEESKPKAKAAKKTTSSRRGRKKSEPKAKAKEAPAEEPVEETVTEEVPDQPEDELSTPVPPWDQEGDEAENKPRSDE